MPDNEENTQAVQSSEENDEQPLKFTVKTQFSCIWLKFYAEQIEFTPVHIPQFKSIAIVQNIETAF